MKPVSGFSLKIEVEVRNKDEAIEAIEAGADIIMLDNFSTVDMKRVAKELKDAYKGQKWFLIEGSGGMTEENCSEFMSPGAVLFLVLFGLYFLAGYLLMVFSTFGT